MTSKASAEVIFGSASRGDSDSLSDRDILIVDSDVKVLRRRRRELEADGWSVASYTFSKLDFLIEKGSLFIQHLKDESRILRDQDGLFTAKVSAFRPKPSYRTEIHENSKIARLVSARPIGWRGALWAADVLYVTVRNFGVLYLADRGRYVFSYRDVLSGLADAGVIRTERIADLLQLRVAKTLYRSGLTIDERLASQIVTKSLNALPPESFPSRSNSMDPRKLIELSSPLPEGDGVYLRLRNLERAYISCLLLYSSVRERSQLEILRRWIADPRAYASLAALIEIDLFREIKQLHEGLERHEARSTQPARVLQTL